MNVPSKFPLLVLLENHECGEFLTIPPLRVDSELYTMILFDEDGSRYDRSTILEAAPINGYESISTFRYQTSIFMTAHNKKILHRFLRS